MITIIRKILGLLGFLLFLLGNYMFFGLLINNAYNPFGSLTFDFSEKHWLSDSSGFCFNVQFPNIKVKYYMDMSTGKVREEDNFPCLQGNLVSGRNNDQIQNLNAEIEMQDGISLSPDRTKAILVKTISGNSHNLHIIDTKTVSTIAILDNQKLLRARFLVFLEIE